MVAITPHDSFQLPSIRYLFASAANGELDGVSSSISADCCASSLSLSFFLSSSFSPLSLCPSVHLSVRIPGISALPKRSVGAGERIVGSLRRAAWRLRVSQATIKAYALKISFLYCICGRLLFFFEKKSRLFSFSCIQTDTDVIFLPENCCRCSTSVF